MKKVFVLGGTGFLGYHTTKELLKRGYAVSTVALPPMPAETLLPKEVECQLGDITQMSDEQVLALLDGCYAFVYAAGVDERVVPDAPAMKFFYEQNVLPTQRMARLAKQSGIKKFVIFGSYFAHFTEAWPEMELKKENGYPRTRLLQEEVAFMEGEGGMDVMSLRLSYIFGLMPGRLPLWSVFVDQVRGQAVVPVFGGGTAMITVQQVAEAAVGVIENGVHRGTYAIGDTNMKFKEFYQIIADVLGQPETQITVVPLEQMLPAMEQLDAHSSSEGKEHGMHMVYSARVQDRDAYLNPEDTFVVLNIKKADIPAVIRETIAVCI